MKYLTRELYINSFEGNRYNDHQDKFLIGILNSEKTKLKDVITGEIVENFHFTSITRLKMFRDGGNNMALGYVTGFRASDASIRQHMLAERINSILTKDILDEKDIMKIKNIMNKEIVRNYEKNLQKINIANEKEKELNKYSIPESERKF